MRTPAPFSRFRSPPPSRLPGIRRLIAPISRFRSEPGTGAEGARRLVVRREQDRWPQLRETRDRRVEPRREVAAASGARDVVAAGIGVALLLLPWLGWRLVQNAIDQLDAAVAAARSERTLQIARLESFSRRMAAMLEEVDDLLGRAEHVVGSYPAASDAGIGGSSRTTGQPRGMWEVTVPH